MRTQDTTGDKVRTSITLEKDLMTTVDEVCKAMDVSRSWLIAEVLNHADLKSLIPPV